MLHGDCPFAKRFKKNLHATLPYCNLLSRSSPRWSTVNVKYESETKSMQVNGIGYSLRSIKVALHNLTLNRHEISRP